MLERLGFGWLERVRLRLWFHFLPHRIVCRFRKHIWDEPSPVMNSGPLHLPPSERTYYLMAVHKQCDRCAAIRDVPYDLSTEALYLEEARLEDEEEWADPEIRAVMKQLR